ncbi:polycystic kidney disease 1 like 1 [Esox lucius]|uniref:polycystic kidney disease 1 like 1 n=1 Tax=Esox lucius TaxID=8010 RepID=UPI00147726D3|nr:polycystic kidney disease 1 like 1 [Esox lucius]
MGDQNTYVNAGAEVSHPFISSGVFEVCVLAENRVGSVSCCVSISVLHSMQPVTVHTERRAYPTNTDISFLALTEEPDPVEFTWHFGDSRPVRTTSRFVRKRYNTPDRYSVVVLASNGPSSVTSQAHPVLVQRAVHANRLLLQPSVLLNHAANFTCRTNAGTDLSYAWSFGDGTSRTGGSMEQHVFHRTGEFTVEVTVSNLVSSASLTAQMFVVDRPCEPPPVKNMGPLKIQVRRYEMVRLGVTYEGEVRCDVSRGLEYRWSLYSSAGLPVHLGPVHAGRQSITLPSHFLHYGVYTAVARVQVVGQVVYSNYSVRVEVVPSPPVSDIQGGSNVFISRGNGSVITLNGQQSYDPDYPMNQLSFSWTCKPISALDSSCFDQYVPTLFSAVVFPVGFLKQDFDQFRFSLTVRSGERTSSADTFITITPRLVRKVSLYWYQGPGDSVNWDQSFSVRAVCENCGPVSRTVRFAWTLYLVKSSRQVETGVPFCHSVDLSAPSNIIGVPPLTPPPSLTSPRPRRTSHASRVTSSNTVGGTSVPGSLVTQSPSVSANHPARSSPEPVSDPVGFVSSAPEPDVEGSGPSGPPYSISDVVDLDNGSLLYSGMPGRSDATEEYSLSPDLPPDYDPVRESGDAERRSIEGSYAGETFGGGLLGTFVPEVGLEGNETLLGPADYDDPFLGIEEGDSGVSGGRPTGVDGGSYGSSGGDSAPAIPESGEDEESNLMDSSPSLVVLDPTLLDLPRELVQRELFESYTYTGISSALIMFKPFTLRAGSKYMLEVTANSHDAVVGQTQLFLSTSPTPRGMTCQVQPSSGVELHTHFSIFCTSGREDLLYEFSFSIGHRTPMILYQGRDFQYYFNLPSGDPDDGYKVTIYTEVRNRFGTATRPCPVTVTVLPSFSRNSSHCNPNTELFESGLRNLSALVQLGNTGEIRNYVHLLSIVLNRLTQDPVTDTQTHTHTRTALIHVVCQLDISDQVSMIDAINLLKDLMHISHQVSLASARAVVDQVQSISDRFHQPSVPVAYLLDSWTLHALVTLLSYSLEAAAPADGLVRDKASVDDVIPARPTDDLVRDKASVDDVTPARPTDDLVRDKASVDDVTLARPTDDLVRDKASVDDVTPARPTDDLVRDKPTDHVKWATPTKLAMQLTRDVLQTTAQLLLKYVLFNEARHYNVTTSVMDLQMTQHSRGQTTVIRSGSATVHLPECLDLVLYGQKGRETADRPQSLCVFCQLTTFTHNPYFWAKTAVQLTGPVIDLTLYNCSTRREVPVRSLSQPINTVFPKTPTNLSSVYEFTLLQSQVNYHSFNITQQALQEAIQVSVEFMWPPNNTFPIMLLFRMFEKPTPSLFHIQSIYRWDRNTHHISLPPSYLSAVGTGYLALLNADYNKTLQHMYPGGQVNYTLRVETSQCLSWDHQQGWMHEGCTPGLGLTSHSGVSCSCSHLRPLTVVQQQIQIAHEDSEDLIQFVSLVSDATVVCVCVVCVCLYAVGTTMCKRADIISEKNQEVHYLSDNCWSDTHLYCVTIHTGLRSSTSMSAQVYIVLYGEDGASLTRQLHVPECPLFRRNSRDTFILSSADCLGPLWGVRLWHDSTGSSPSWYLRQVEVCEVKDNGRSWLFLGRCWLAVDEGDGRVERRLRVRQQGPGFTELLCLKLSEYMSDFHLWLSVYGGPAPSAFTRTQRLSVCVLLCLGYMCVNVLILSGFEDKRTSELGLVDVSVVSLTTGLLSALTVLPIATAVSLLFRQRKVGVKRSAVKQETVRLQGIYSLEVDSLTVSDSWNNLQRWAQEAWGPKYEASSLCSQDQLNQDNDYSEGRSSGCGEEGVSRNSSVARPAGATVPEDMNVCQERVHNLRDNSSKLPGNIQTSGELGGRVSHLTRWCHPLAWVLCLVLGLPSLVVTVVFGIRFSSTKTLLWIHSLFISLISCVFLLQPAMILAGAMVVSFWHRKSLDIASVFGVTRFQAKVLKLWNQNGSGVPEDFQLSPHQPQQRCPYFDRVLKARQRARYLRLIGPPTPGELRRTAGRRMRETLIHKTLREMAVCVLMLFLLLCMTYGSFPADHCRLTRTIQTQFTRSPSNPFLSVQTHEEFWNWTLLSLVDSLPWRPWNNNTQETGKADASQGTFILTGEPILWKIDSSKLFTCQVPSAMANLFPECLTVNTPGVSDGHNLCSRLRSYTGNKIAVRLSLTRSECVSRLEFLRSTGWLGRRTIATATHFTLYSPSSNQLASVTLLAERSLGGALHTSVHVESARLYHTPTAWFYFSMVSQHLFLLVSLIQLILHICSAREKDMLGYCRDPRSWLQVAILLLVLVYFVYQVNRSILSLEVIDLLQRQGFRAHIDLSLLFTCELHTRTLCGVLLLLLAVQSVCLMGVNRATTASLTLLKLTFSRLIWPMLSGAVLLLALCIMGNVLVLRGPWEVSTLARSPPTSLSLSRDTPGSRAPTLSSQPHKLHTSYSQSPLCLALMVAWTTLVIGVVSSLVGVAKRAGQRRSQLTLSDLVGYIRDWAAVSIGRRKLRRTDVYTDSKTFYLQEFESLLDELLFRLNSLSNNQQNTLPPKDIFNRVHSPFLCPTLSPSSLASQRSGVSEIAQVTEETLLSYHPDVRNLPLTLTTTGWSLT